MLPGKSMNEKKMFFQENYDSIRTILMQEPRGNSGILAVLIPPSIPGTDYGVIFADYRGYVDMCVHGTIGVVSTLLECGLASEKVLRSGKISFDTSVGVVSARFNFDKERVKSVTVSNVPSFFLHEESIEVPGFGKIQVSIAFGGNLYAYVNANSLGFKITPANLTNILSTARLFLKELKKLKLPDTHETAGKEIIGVCFYEDLAERHSRNIMVADRDLFDRSPCGTGTCGRMAVLNAHGRLRVGETFRNESILRTEFRGTITKQSKTMGKLIITPEITGSAYLTGISDIIVSEGDNLARGYHL